MLSSSDNKQADAGGTFNSTSRYHDDLINVDFEQMESQIYPPELQLIKANYFHTETPFLDMDVSLMNGIVSFKINGKWDDFNFKIVNFLFIDDAVPRSLSYGAYILNY